MPGGSKAVKIKLFKQQEGICYLCNGKMTLTLNKDNSCTIDHVVPQFRGGTEVKGACWKCNNMKGGLSAEEFKARMGWGSLKGVTLWKGDQK